MSSTGSAPADDASGPSGAAQTDTGRVKAYAKEAGADLVGIADPDDDITFEYTG